MSKEIANINSNLPAFLPKEGDKRGTEHLTQKDIQIPRLNIAQGLSPELDEDNDARYIPGLKMSEMFNSMTKAVYGNGPIEFFIVAARPPRGVEFIPREEGGGIRDRNVPVGDPRLEWNEDENGKTIKPIATLFYDYIIILAKTKEMIGLSMKGTSIKAAKTLNGLIAMRNQAIFAGKYAIKSAKEKNAQASYGVFVVENAGWVESEEQMSELEMIYEQFKTKEVVIHEEGAETPEEEKSEEFQGQF